MGTINWIGYQVDEVIARKVDAAADSAGIPRNVLRAVVLSESGGNPLAIGDHDIGGSVGLLQLYRGPNGGGGQGAGYTVAYLQDPDNNLAIGVPYIARAWRETAGISPMRERVARTYALSGHPNDLPAGKPYVEIITKKWEELEGIDPTPERTVTVAGVSLDPGRMEEQARRGIAYVREHPGTAAAIAGGALLVLIL
ncbi:MAG: lytic transglycosylase domain-containing protein [Dehalococcoidia bacterium]|nr:lytic transglycosylase domain-containing protein [Dehalococcoidia bacterium]